MKRCPRSGIGGVSIALACLVVTAGACDPYGTFNDTPDDGLGPVDPVSFPPANVGTGGDRKRPGRGRFNELIAYVEGAEVGYFSFALPMMAAGTDPLRVLDDGKPYGPVPTPAAYVFDSTATSPFPDGDRYPCSPPAGYLPDARRDEVDYTKQNNVFSALPTATYAEGALPATSYVPVMAEARLSSSGLPCQQLKSEKRIEETTGNKPALTGKYVAWLVIDPSAPVFPRDVPATGIFPMGHPMAGQSHPGLGLQRWGWFNRYLLAYLDGGYIPTVDETVGGGTMAMPTMRPVKRMRPQRLFIPRAVLGAMMMAAPGRAGVGYDVLEFRRGQPEYSPLCQVWVYGDPMAPAAPADLPRDARMILDPMAMGMNPMPASPVTYVYCLQVR